jgi:anaerobic ribonucleoside-triphosphate reductase
MTENELSAQRTKCEVYSRVVGYIRPVNQWNEGKQAEYTDRVEFEVCK